MFAFVPVIKEQEPIREVSNLYLSYINKFNSI